MSYDILRSNRLYNVCECYLQAVLHIIYPRFITSIILLFILNSFLYAQKYPDPTIDSLLNDGINNLINQEYRFAERDFNQLKKNYPELPLGDLYIAANYMAKSYDYYDDFNDELISNSLNSAMDKAENLLDKDDSNIWNIYFFALSKGYYAYYKALNGSWFSAISNGFDAIEEFERCLRKDSSFYDAYIAIGTFKYWKSRKTEFLHWSPFVSDESQEGIKYLEKAINNPSYNYYLAINSLQWIYIDQKKYSEAIKLSEKALKKYPRNRSFKWALARVYEETDKKKAIKVYNEIFDSYSKINELNKFNEILLKHLMAQQYEQLGDLVKAQKLCDEILSIDYTFSPNKERLDNRIERVKELRKKIISESVNR